ncbi:unnamed protein product [Ciceribacter sp. T2.26MG-112.2]|nr:unnamed protein product [Ciceribacter naphthalenivorans]SSX47386.1 unnamed protein product [Ciceribacter naphthalenivorans]
MRPPSTAGKGGCNRLFGRLRLKQNALLTATDRKPDVHIGGTALLILRRECPKGTSFALLFHVVD